MTFPVEHFLYEVTWSPWGDQKGLARASTILLGGVLLTWVTLVEGFSSPPPPPGAPPEEPSPGGPDWKKWVLLVAAAVVTAGAAWFLWGGDHPPSTGGELVVSSPPVGGVISTTAVVAAAAVEVLSPAVEVAAALTVPAPPAVEVLSPAVEVAAVAATDPPPGGGSSVEVVDPVSRLFELSHQQFTCYKPHQLVNLVRFELPGLLTPSDELRFLAAAKLYRKFDFFTSMMDNRLEVYPPGGGPLEGQVSTYVERVILEIARQTHLNPGGPDSLWYQQTRGLDLVHLSYWEFYWLDLETRRSLVADLNLSEAQLEKLDQRFELERREPYQFMNLASSEPSPSWGRPPRSHAEVRFRAFARVILRDSSNG